MWLMKVEAKSTAIRVKTKRSRLQITVVRVLPTEPTSSRVVIFATNTTNINEKDVKI